MSKYGQIINQAKNQKDGKPENNKTRKPESKSDVEIAVNLSIKVPANLRRHWVAEAKRQGTTITAEVTAALNEKFGMP